MNRENRYTEIYKYLPVGKYKGQQVHILFGKGAVMPWCVSYAGNGHYFGSVQELSAYMAGRGWIREHMHNSMIATIQAKLEKDGG